MPRERALGEFVRQQLRPLSARDDVTRYIHILNWEAVRPTAVYRKLVSEEAAPFLGVQSRSEVGWIASEAVWLICPRLTDRGYASVKK